MLPKINDVTAGYQDRVRYIPRDGARPQGVGHFLKRVAMVYDTSPRVGYGVIEKVNGIQEYYKTLLTLTNLSRPVQTASITSLYNNNKFHKLCTIFTHINTYAQSLHLLIPWRRKRVLRGC